ncbi:FkbM family methyltransferase [Cyanothece sp. BG0011]|uniref:FkbM family methyltransferase n=1 Tax=Cyanothece sp. BG0011 TaxID=2082950 RepID=UPI0018E4EBC2|nr:FkbM family methyltransferase [Cyanothece sp. BG0011]
MMVRKESLPYSVSLVLFTRYPDPGKVKTRLAWDIGDRTASEIHRYLMSQMLRRLLREMDGVNIIVNYTGVDSVNTMIDSFDPDLRLDINQGIKSGILSFIQQPSSSFGERMKAIAKQLGKVIIIGSDIPGITADILNEAIDCVNREEAAIALTEDGGYYLIALPYYRDVFTNINYSLKNVYQQTYDLMQKNYASASILNHTLLDIDEINDLKSLGLTQLIKQNQIEISVIIPTLNEVNAIYETLVNVVKQAKTVNKIEILVIDGGSKDNTLQRVKDFKKHYPHILIQWLTISSLGRAFQMNIGLRHSSGKYLVFCHADTLLPSEWDKKVVSVLSNEKIKLAYFDLQFNADHLGLKWVAWTANQIRRSPYGDQVFCVRRNDFKEIGGFDYLSLLEDVTLFDNKIDYQHCQRIPNPVITNARKYSNKKENYTYLSIFKNVGKNCAIMLGNNLLNLPACQLRKIPYGSSPNHELLEVPFQEKIYTFKYHFPKQLFHKLLIWNKVYYQQSMNQLIPKILNYCQGDDIFIDIRANVGIISCLLSMELAKHRIKTDIIAFETVPYLYQLFKDNYSLYINETRNKIYLENIAIGDQKGEYPLKLDDKSSSYIDQKEEDNIIKVKQIALDKYEFPIEKKISVIKLELDGNQLNVIKGMIKIMKQHQPILLLTSSIAHFPNAQDDANNNLKAIINLLNNLNYKVDKWSSIDYIAYSI